MRNTVLKEIPLSLLAAIVLYLMINDIKFSGHQKDIISLADGIILLGFMTIFMYYMLHLAKSSGEDEDPNTKNDCKSSNFSLLLD
ncbi:MAG: hypothetical protein IPJ13_04290 [Saprospiraceae bacterium]|nr:hypothetical protein [Saprospiraceae bacterium]